VIKKTSELIEQLSRVCDRLEEDCEDLFIIIHRAKNGGHIQEVDDADEPDER
jgi:hypothetical protein